MIYGYCRISTPKQSLERQIKNISREYPTAEIYSEAYTGTKQDRPVWNKLKRKLQAGDTVIFDSVSRMSRNAAEGVTEYFNLYDKGITLVFLKEPIINTETYKRDLERGNSIPMTGEIEDILLKALIEYMKALAARQITIAFDQAEKEVQDLHQRTKEGIEAARRSRNYDPNREPGRKAGTKIETKKAKAAKEQIRKYSKDFDGSLSDIDTIRLTGISRNSFYKYKAELRAEE